MAIIHHSSIIIIIFFHFFVATITSTATLCFTANLLKKVTSSVLLILAVLENFFKDFEFFEKYSINQTLIKIIVLKIQADNVHRTLYVSCQ